MVDMPDLPPQYAQVMVVQAGAAKQGAAKADRTLGICQLIENRRLPSGEPRISAINSMSPILALRNYFKFQEKRNIEGPSTATALENPKHGELKDQGTSVLRHGTLVDTGERRYSYIPAPGYFGKDRAVLLVEMGGFKIRVVYSFHVVEGFVEGNEGLCPPPHVRKMSLNPDDPNGGLASFQHLK